MLTLFTNVTQELSDLERDKLVPMLLDTLSTTNEDNRMRGKVLAGWLKSCGYQTTEIRIRKMVSYVRVMNLARPKVLIGAQNGYYLTEDLKVIDDQIESLEGRVNQINASIESIKAQRDCLKYSR